MLICKYSCNFKHSSFPGFSGIIQQQIIKFVFEGGKALVKLPILGVGVGNCHNTNNDEYSSCRIICEYGTAVYLKGYT